MITMNRFLGGSALAGGQMKLLAGPVLIIMILSMMILPLPPFVLDLFFTFNITLSVNLCAGRPAERRGRQEPSGGQGVRWCSRVQSLIHAARR